MIRLLIALLLISNVPEDSQVCKCYEGIGSSSSDNPLQSYYFSTGHGVSVCGYQEKSVFTEFSVFDCSSGKSITQYGAIESCKLKFENDTLRISRLKFLPTEWSSSHSTVKWHLAIIGNEFVCVKDSAVSSQGFVGDFECPSISKTAQEEFLDDIEWNNDNGLKHDWAWEKILGKLEVLSLMGNERALILLRNIATTGGYTFDGAIAEQYKEALATINLVMGK